MCGKDLTTVKSQDRHIVEPYFPGSVVVASPLPFSMYSLMSLVQVLSHWSKPIFEEKLSRSFRVKETRILTQQRWFFGTVIHHLFGLLAFWIKSLFLAQQIVSQFIGLLCGELQEPGFGNTLIKRICLHTFHDGLWEGISEMKGPISLDMIHSHPCFLEKHTAWITKFSSVCELATGRWKIM